MAKKLTAVLVDDELFNLQVTVSLLQEYCPNVEVLKTFTKPSQAVKFISINKPDILLLDIKMPTMSGFDLLEKIERYPFQLIFISAHSEEAARAFKFSALEFLLKPVDPIELKKAIQKAAKKKFDDTIIERYHQAQQNMVFFNAETDKPIVINTSNSIEYIFPTQILCIFADRNYSTIHLQNGTKILVTKQIGRFDEMLEHKGFFRSHKSCLINKNKIVRYVTTEGGYIELVSGIKCPLSRNKRDEFFKLWVI